MKTYKCPKCGMVATDKDFDNNTSELNFTVGIDDVWDWECCSCGHEWKEKNRKVIE